MIAVISNDHWGKIAMTQFLVNTIPDKSIMTTLGRKNYKIHEAIAELVDNSIDAKVPKEKLIIDIKISNKEIIIRDNGTGMDKETFSDSVVLGKSSKYKKLGIYGLGLKTSCMNLGRYFTVITSPLGESKKYIYEFDEDEWQKKSSLNWQDYPCSEEDEDEDMHYTTIKIKKLRSNMYAFGRRIENKILFDFGLRYAYLIEKGEVLISVIDNKKRINIQQDFPKCEQKSKLKFDFLLDKENPETRIYGWVGLRWDPIREKVMGSQKGNYGFITYRNGRLITLYDDLKVDKEIFAIRRHPQWATIIGVVNMDCIPVENDKRNFIQESPLYIRAIKIIRDYVKKIEEEIKIREGESEIAEDIKEITENLVDASEKALDDKDIKSLIEDNADKEGLENYGKLIKKNISGKLIRTKEELIFHFYK